MDVPQISFQPVPTKSMEQQTLWNDALVIPVYLALGLLTLQALVALFSFTGISTLFGYYEVSSEESSPSVTAPQAPGFFIEAKQHIKSQGEMTALMNILRLFGSLTLAGLTIVAFLVLESDDETEVSTLRKWGKKHKFGKHRGPSRFACTHDEWIEIIYLVLYSYASFLALVALVSQARSRSVAGIHLTLIMLAVMAVYIYRDLYPLATFTLVPKDIAQGWLLWSRVVIVYFMAVLIPLVSPRIYRPVNSLNPGNNLEQTASWLSFLTFTFFDPMIWLAARSPHLEYESLPPLADYDAAAHLVAKSEQTLDPFLRRKRTHIFWGLLDIFAWEYIQLVLIILLRALSGLIAPFGLNKLLAYLETKGEGVVVRPWFWILSLFLGPVIGSIALQYHNFLSTRTLVRTEGVLTQLVFDHALRIRLTEDLELDCIPTVTLKTQSIVERDDSAGEEALHDSNHMSTASKKKGDVGTNTNPHAVPSRSIAANPQPDVKAGFIHGIHDLVVTDLRNIAEGRDFFLILLGPLQVILGGWFLYAILGWSGSVGVGVMIVTAPLPCFISTLIDKIQSERMNKTDARVQSVIEILSVIRMTKLFGWEQKVNNMIAEKREIELQWLKRHQLWILGNTLLNFFIPLLTMLATFTSYTTLQKQELTASIVFSSMAVFGMIKGVLQDTFFIIPMMINAKVSLNRINDFLLNTELLDRFTRKEENDPSQNIDSQIIGFRNATFFWGRNHPDALSGHHFCLVVEGELFFQPHKLNLVIGPTGSGKTSLLMALLGEMCYRSNGETSGFNLPRDGGVAYAAQEAWVQSNTIKENILLGKPYEKERYDKVIYQCGLERDLSLFEAGDETEVGENGLSLSDGQKARISLARAAYSDAKIMLLDDILASLDVLTARFIVEQCLKGHLLEGRTIILVTHNIAMVAPIADFVVSIGLDGRITSQGAISDALMNDPVLFQEIEESNDDIQRAEDSTDLSETNDKDSSGELIATEKIALGHIGWSALTLYFSSMGGAVFWAAAFGGMLFAELALSLSGWFLGYWATEYDDHTGWAVPVAYYLGIYALILLAVMALYAIGLGLLVVGSIRASRTIHRKLVTSVLHTNLKWLDTAHTARIVKRCMQDILTVDGPVSQYFGDLAQSTFALLVKFCAIVLFVPAFVLPSIVVFIVGGLCGQLYIGARLSIKREMSNRHSSVLANFGAAISGLASIRAYGAQAMCREESLKRIDGYTRAARTFWNCNRWISFRGDVIGSVFAAGLAAYLIYGYELRTASNTGFSLTMAVSFSSMILWWVRVANEIEVQGNSLERIASYLNIEQEPNPTEAGKPPAYWPASGALKVENLSARYSVDGPKVLRDLSFEIRSGERVGIVGRTGSGKSSLTLSLLRCIPTEGHVTLDGLSIGTVNLDALRSSITIIPQQPELLRGTLRENLDPFFEHSDATLNGALRAAGLFNLQDEIDSSRLTLESSVSSGGNNLSVGQRQILALARAVVRQSKLVILDEATSAIDYAADTIIQNNMRGVLQDASLIIVAHRLQSIMNADKIVVLDAGDMVEFDSPANLLKKDGGYFRSLVDESGDRDALWNMAKNGSRGNVGKHDQS